MTDKELPERHEIRSEDASHGGVLQLLEISKETVKAMPEDKRYEVTIKVAEK